MQTKKLFGLSCFMIRKECEPENLVQGANFKNCIMNRLYWNSGFIFRKLKSNELSVGSGNTKSELKLTN